VLYHHPHDWLYGGAQQFPSGWWCPTFVCSWCGDVCVDIFTRLHESPYLGDKDGGGYGQRTQAEVPQEVAVWLAGFKEVPGRHEEAGRERESAGHADAEEGEVEPVC
jgi:hypothetical protein